MFIIEPENHVIILKTPEVQHNHPVVSFKTKVSPISIKYSKTA